MPLVDHGESGTNAELGISRVLGKFVKNRGINEQFPFRVRFQQENSNHLLPLPSSPPLPPTCSSSDKVRRLIGQVGGCWCAGCSFQAYLLGSVDRRNFELMVEESSESLCRQGGVCDAIGNARR